MTATDIKSGKATMQQIIDEKVMQLMHDLSEGNDDSFKAYMKAASRFHKYSFGNQLMIASQRRDATAVAGFNTWKSLGRTVRKGEKGIAIFAPMVVKSKDEDKTRVIGFRIVYVFDISQTNGDALPTDEASLGAGTLGQSWGGKIAMLDTLVGADYFGTLVHEIAHTLMHNDKRRATLSKTVKETEAEAVAYIVGSAIGLEMANASAQYIKLYSGDVDVFRKSLMHIQIAASVILKAITGATNYARIQSDASIN